MPVPETEAETVRWDVIGEHFDEAEFAVASWRDALASPQYTLAELADGPEEQLLAHIDGLLIGGPAVADRILVPELEAPEEPAFERSLVAAMVLLAAGGQEVVWKALSSEEAVVRAAACEAFVLGASSRLDAWLPGQLAPGAPVLPPGQRSILLDIAARRGLPLPNLLESLQSSDPDELVAAIEAARSADPGKHLLAVEHLVDHADSRVRDAAVVTGLCYGSHHAWQACLRHAAGTRMPQPRAMLLVALLGEPREHSLLVEHLARKSHRNAALAALAYCGQAAVIPALLPLLSADDPVTAALASLAFGVITGVDTSKAPYVATEPAEEAEGLPSLDEDDLDADLVPGVDEELAPPDAEEIASFWQLHAATFDTRRRLLGGVPWTLTACLDGLAVASMQVRHALSLWLLVRSGGVARIATHAWSSTQRIHVARARALTEQALIRRFGGW